MQAQDSITRAIIHSVAQVLLSYHIRCLNFACDTPLKSHWLAHHQSLDGMQVKQNESADVAASSAAAEVAKAVAAAFLQAAGNASTQGAHLCLPHHTDSCTILLICS